MSHTGEGISIELGEGHLVRQRHDDDSVRGNNKRMGFLLLWSAVITLSIIYFGAA